MEIVFVLSLEKGGCAALPRVATPLPRPNVVGRRACETCPPASAQCHFPPCWTPFLTPPLLAVLIAVALGIASTYLQRVAAAQGQSTQISDPPSARCVDERCASRPCHASPPGPPVPARETPRHVSHLSGSSSALQRRRKQKSSDHARHVRQLRKCNHACVSELGTLAPFCQSGRAPDYFEPIRWRAIIMPASIEFALRNPSEAVWRDPWRTACSMTP